MGLCFSWGGVNTKATVQRRREVTACGIIRWNSLRHVSEAPQPSFSAPSDNVFIAKKMTRSQVGLWAFVH